MRYFVQIASCKYICVTKLRDMYFPTQVDGNICSMLKTAVKEGKKDVEHVCLKKCTCEKRVRAQEDCDFILPKEHSWDPNLLKTSLQATALNCSTISALRETDEA